MDFEFLYDNEAVIIDRFYSMADQLPEGAFIGGIHPGQRVCEFDLYNKGGFFINRFEVKNEDLEVLND